MNINVIGGGPGGLYASALIKKSHPDWDIDVYERDPADNTYGWGIVFSGSTLRKLREADKKTYDQITDAFAKWDPIDVYKDGSYVRCGGHTFSGLMRADLKDILRERCDELGVDMHWEHTVEDPKEYAEEADMLLGADGLNSVTREAYEDKFKPRVEMGSAKFAWFGTDKPFDVFTFIFRENDAGLWRIHAYPGRKSTFIVECTEETFKNAGLDEMDKEKGLAYIEDLFSDHLGDYELKSKLYSWRNFPVVKNKTWSYDNVCLLGDAAHTAHYSVGSGTKMAMEDAIALHDAFEEKDAENVRRVSNWYEKERRDSVERIQEAAETSQDYFEKTERYFDLPAEQFAFNMLTRSGRITYDELKIRDPDYTDDFDRWFAQYANGHSDEPVIAEPPMFQPLELGGVKIPNRAVFAPGPSSDGTTSHPSTAQRDRLVRLAQKNTGLTLTEPVTVSSRGRLHPGTPGIINSEQADYWEEAVSQMGDARVGMELFHAGRRGATESRERGLDRPLDESDAWELLAPSAKPYTRGGQTPKAMDADDLATVREEFATAAERADEAGFDLVQLNMAHGYLLSSFLSPLTNERDDEYGGSFENRLRYPIEVFNAVDEVWPNEKPLTVKLNATDWRPNGLSVSDSFGIAQRFDEIGADLLTVTAGQTTPNDRAKYDQDVLARYSEQIKNEVDVHAMSTNFIDTTDDVNSQIGRATADLCTWYPPSVDVNSL